jgi:hypothetical protein
MTRIKELFVKEIDRKINGVIKADSQEEKDFKDEIEEYVITSELTGRFNEFLERYVSSITAPTEDIGALISAACCGYSSLNKNGAAYQSLLSSTGSLTTMKFCLSLKMLVEKIFRLDR